MLCHYFPCYLAQWLTQNRWSDKYSSRILFWGNRAKRSRNLMLLTAVLQTKSKSVLFPFCGAASAGLCPACSLSLPDAPWLSPHPWVPSHWPCPHLWSLVFCWQIRWRGGKEEEPWYVRGTCQFLGCKVSRCDWFQATIGLTIACKTIPEYLTISSVGTHWLQNSTGFSAPAVSVVEEISPGI